jgi:septal ring factor EnvC (AmiA/AmiB activator)
VNAHLNSEVERLTLAVDALEAEREAYQRHIKDLAKKLAEARAQLPQAAHAAAEAEAEASAAEAADAEASQQLQSDAFAAGAADGVPSSSGGEGAPEEQSWLQDAAWQRLQAAGRRQGWLVDPEEVLLGEELGRGTFGELAGCGSGGGVSGSVVVMMAAGCLVAGNSGGTK